jgi:hypothetical protein
LPLNNKRLKTGKKMQIRAAINWQEKQNKKLKENRMKPEKTVEKAG